MIQHNEEYNRLHGEPEDYEEFSDIESSNGSEDSYEPSEEGISESEGAGWAESDGEADDVEEHISEESESGENANETPECIQREDHQDEDDIADDEESDEGDVHVNAEPARDHCVTDLEYVFRTMQKFSHKDKRSRARGGRRCQGTLLEATYSSIVYNGIVATLRLHCGVCNAIVEIPASPPNLSPPLNDALVLGTVLTGGGLYQHQTLFSALNMKPMADKKYYKIEKKLQEKVEEILDDFMNEAIEQEKALSPELNGFGLISGGSDGSWFARPQRTEATSLLQDTLQLSVGIDASVA